MMNNLQMIQNFVKNGITPKKIIEQSIKSNNPIMGNLIELAKKGDYKAVENFARNIYKEKGGDFDKDFNTFMSNFKK